MNRMTRWGHILVLVLSGQFSVASGDAVESALALIPADTRSALIVPDLDRLDDELMTWLEGMDRAGLLLGADPLEHILVLAGIPLHVHEEAALVIAERPDGELAIVVPVTDGQAFLTGNFQLQADPPGAWASSSGRIWWASDAGSHVILTTSPADSVAALGAVGVADWWTTVAPAGPDLIDDGDLLLVGDLATVRGAMVSALGPLATLSDRITLPPSWRDTLSASSGRLVAFLFGTQATAIAVDFDPLALVLRTKAMFVGGTAAERLTQGGERQSRGLDRLPFRPYLAAGALNLDGLGAHGALDAAGELLGPFAPPEWVRGARSVQWGAFRPAAGLGAGMLGDSVVLVETDDAPGARVFMRNWITARGELDDGWQRAVTYREDMPVRNAGTADTYEVRITGGDGGGELARRMRSWIYGPMGWRGLVADTEGGLALTYSRRPSTLRAVRASCADAPEAGGGLGRDPIISAMRGWMPATRDLEMYLNVGAIVELVTEAIESYPGLKHLPLPEIAGGAPPIGIGATLADGSVESTVILPAAVVAGLLDWGFGGLREILPDVRPAVQKGDE